MNKLNYSEFGDETNEEIQYEGVRKGVKGTVGNRKTRSITRKNQIAGSEDYPSGNNMESDLSSSRIKRIHIPNQIRSNNHSKSKSKSRSRSPFSRRNKRIEPSSKVIDLNFLFNLVFLGHTEIIV